MDKVPENNDELTKGLITKEELRGVKVDSETTCGFYEKKRIKK
jgi:hypothetical protein